MSTKIGDNKTALMKTADLVAAAKTGKPKSRVKAMTELAKRGKTDLVNKSDEAAA